MNRIRLEPKDKSLLVITVLALSALIGILAGHYKSENDRRKK